MPRLPTIPGYELLECLGGGPLTAVYAGREQDTDRPCAVKVVRPEWPEQDTAIKLLQREARAGLAVRHSHLVRITTAHVTRPPWFLVMELLPGESLRSRLQRDFQLDPASTIWIGRQAAEALVALHAAGFLHGDIKPDNLRLVDDGTAKLIDLGFAHRPGENAALFRDGYVLGTANYLAPELCGPVPFEDFGSDLFSLGVTLFEMLTGRLPYPPGSVRQTFRRHQCDPPADLGTVRPDLPDSIVGLVNRLLAREPDQRLRASAVVHHLVRLEIAWLGRRRSA
jgi:serine/threonine protein kinase